MVDMYEILQLCWNRSGGRELQSWVKRRTMLVLPHALDPTAIDIDSVQDNLEDKLCNDVCLHQFKIKENGNIIFNSRW